MKFRTVVTAVLLAASVALLSAQGPWRTPPGSTGKARIISTSADALGVGCGGAAPASSACTGGIYAGALITQGLANLSAAGALPWHEVTSISSGTVNNFSTQGSGNTIIHCTSASALTFTGFTGGTSGQQVLIEALSGPVSFTHNDSGSTSGNRLYNYATVGTTTLLAGSALYTYSGSVWRLTHIEQGAWITPTFSAGDYTSNTGNFWSVDAGDVTTAAYYLAGRRLTMNWVLANTTVSVGVGAELRVTLPAGLMLARSAYSTGWYNNATTIGVGPVIADSGVPAKVKFLLADGSSTWALGINNTTVTGSITVEVQ